MMLCYEVRKSKKMWMRDILRFRGAKINIAPLMSDDRVEAAEAAEFSGPACLALLYAHAVAHSRFDKRYGCCSCKS